MPGETIYVFKQYGTHECYAFKYQEILKNKNILFSINPVDMIDVHKHEFFAKYRSTECYVLEMLPHNTYKIIGGNNSFIYSGEYIFNNIDMFENMCRHDLAKISYETGFCKGRKLSKDIAEAIVETERKLVAQSKSNIIQIKSDKN